MTSYESNIIQHFKEDKEAYTEFFKDAMKKFGVESPDDLKDDETKKEFYKYVDDNYKAQNEAAPKGWEGTVKAMKDNDEIDNPYALTHWMKGKGYKSHKKEFKEYMELKRHQYSEASNIKVKSDAYTKAMSYLDKYFLNLAATPAPKKAKKVSKIMTTLQKIFFSKDESVNETLLSENPAAMAAAAMATVKMKNAQGKQIKGISALRSKDPSVQKKAKSIFQQLKDKFKKKAAPKKQSQSDADFWKKQLHVAGIRSEAASINVEPNWEGVWRFFKHMQKTSPGQWNKMKGAFRDSWIKLQRMADKKGWVAESVKEAYDYDKVDLKKPYGVFLRGGSIGSGRGHIDRKTGAKLVATFDDEGNAKRIAQTRNRRLSPGEKKYYGMKYTAIKMSRVKLIKAHVEKSISEADGMSELVVKRAIDKAMQAAGIKVLKIDKMKSDKIKEPYGWFYKVKAGNKNDIMPFYVDKRGNVNLGVSSKDWIIGDVIGGHSKMVKNLKDFKKTDLDEASLAKVKEVAMPLGSYLDHALADVEHLIDVVKSEHAEDAYRSPKKSGKLLAAAFKLLKKVK